MRRYIRFQGKVAKDETERQQQLRGPLLEGRVTHIFCEGGFYLVYDKQSCTIWCR